MTVNPITSGPSPAATTSNTRIVASTAFDEVLDEAAASVNMPSWSRAAAFVAARGTPDSGAVAVQRETERELAGILRLRHLAPTGGSSTDTGPTNSTTPVHDPVPVPADMPPVVEPPRSATSLTPIQRREMDAQAAHLAGLEPTAEELAAMTPLQRRVAALNVLDINLAWRYRPGIRHLQYGMTRAQWDETWGSWSLPAWVARETSVGYLTSFFTMVKGSDEYYATLDVAAKAAQVFGSTGA